MTNNIQEIFWMMDATTQEVIHGNPAYAAITGHSIESLRTNPSSYTELIHPEDRIRVLSRLQETVSSGSLMKNFVSLAPMEQFVGFGQKVFRFLLTQKRNGLSARHKT